MRAIDDRRLMMREEDTSGIRRDDTVVENRNFSVADEKSYDKMEEIFRALANKTRLLILKEISYGPLRISELSRKIGISNSNVLFHIEQLRKAGLLLVDFEPSRKGFAQVVYPAHILNLVCNIRGDNREGDIAVRRRQTVSMPVGQYSDVEYDDYMRYMLPDGTMSVKSGIFAPERANALLVWFYRSGYITYNFPVVFSGDNLSALEFRMELCSEAPFHKEIWKSTIDFRINDIKLCSYISGGDYGDRPGRLNSDFYPKTMTQYGMPIVIKTDRSGTYLNGNFAGGATVSDIVAEVYGKDRIALKIEVPSDAEFIGGINIFGKGCGDYPFDIEMTAYFDE